jgi:predicted transcriptional regulator
VQQTMDQLIDRLARVMDAMGEVTTINKLITKLREIEKGQEEDITRILKKIRQAKEKDIEDVLDKLEKPNK